MTKIIQRHDTAANWTTVNPVLAAGEMGVEYQEGTVTFTLSDAVTTNGTPTFNNGLVSNFSTSNYYSMNTMLVEEMVVQFTTGSNITQGQYISTYPSLNIENGKLRLGLPSGFQQLMTVSASTQYTIKVINYSSKIEVYSSSTLIATFDTSLSSGGPRFGSNIDGYPFLGTIDFRNTSINGTSLTNKTEVFSGTSRFKFGNGVTAWSSLAYAAGEGGSGTTLTSTDGTTTYSKLALGDTLSVTDTSTKELNGLTQTGGTLNSELEFTGASGASLKMTEKYSLSTADSWEFQIKYKHNGGGNSPTIFGYASGSDFKTPAFIYEGGNLKLYVSYTGNSWQISYNTGLVPVSGTIYYFKIGFTGSQYYVRYNTTGWSDEFTTVAQHTSSTKAYCSDYFMLMNLSLNNSYYNTGTMYLQDTALIINENEVWRGAKIIPGDIILDANVYTKTETDGLLNTKQNELTAAAPLKIYSGDIQVPNVEPSEPSAISSNNILTCSATSNASFGNGIDLSTASSWEYRIKFKFPGWDYGYQALLGTLADNPYDSPVLNFIQSDRHIVLYTSSNGSSWDIQPLKPNSPFVSGGIYYLSFGFTGSQYYIKYNESGWNGAFTTLATVSTNTKIRSWSGKKGLGSVVQPFYGDIYLEESSLIINGEVAWTGTTLQEGGTYIGSSPATTSSLGVVQPDGTSITVNEAGVISGQDVKTFTGYSDTGTLVLKSINGVLQWVAES